MSYPKVYDFISIFDPAGITAAVKSNAKTALKLPFRRLVRFSISQNGMFVYINFMQVFCRRKKGL